MLVSIPAHCRQVMDYYSENNMAFEKVSVKRNYVGKQAVLDFGIKERYNKINVGIIVFHDPFNLQIDTKFDVLCALEVTL